MKCKGYKLSLQCKKGLFHWFQMIKSSFIIYKHLASQNYFGFIQFPINFTYTSGETVKILHEIYFHRIDNFDHYTLLLKSSILPNMTVNRHVSITFFKRTHTDYSSDMCDQMYELILKLAKPWICSLHSHFIYWFLLGQSMFLFSVSCNERTWKTS